MFAGPNGSGKSSLIRQLAKEYVADGMFHLNHYINADDILRQLQSDEGFSFTTLGLTVNIELLRESLISGHRIPRSHPFLNSSQIADSV